MIGKIRVFSALLFVAVATLVLVPLQLLSMKTGLYREGIVPRLWHRAILAALGFRVHVSGVMTDKRPLLIASNHVSWTDIMVLGSIADMSFIAKSEMAGWPLIGWLALLQRTVFIERERKRKSGVQASEIAARLAAGDAMVLFAEGTTGDGNLLLPFKSTLFGAAAMAIGEGAVETVFIQPVAILYTRLHGIPMGRQHRRVASWIGDSELAPHIVELLAQGAIDVEVYFGEPVEFSAGGSRKEAARQVERRVRAMIEEARRNPRRRSRTAAQTESPVFCHRKALEAA
ncbi:MAG: 1-acyl-sn-glycerol-3-phosphate acyltransferase [Pseudaminobacter sp.]|nr:1-acyl-sn-glycerol-3-phosphate acyltransferase [Pseudaminobacter sp.]